jgi:hypothetical protein
MIQIQKSYASNSLRVGTAQVPIPVLQAAFKLFNFGDLDSAKALLEFHGCSEEEAMAVLTAMQDKFNGTLRTYGVDAEVLP